MAHWTHVRRDGGSSSGEKWVKALLTVLYVTKDWPTDQTNIWAYL
jgi:hypothetical protein